jgi:feruloyl-CoA synthase
MVEDPSAIPYRETGFLPVDLEVTRRADGTLLLRSRIPLELHDHNLPRLLAAQARMRGEQAWLVQRQGPARAWTPLSYAAAKRQADAVAQWLMDRGLGPARPILVISGNSIAHAIVKLGGMAAGVPACPVSANYGLLDPSFERLRHVVRRLRPGMVFVEQAGPYARALQAVDFGDAAVVTRAPADSPRPAVDLEALLATPVTAAVEARIGAIGADDPAAYMLTSGSTGVPRIVVQTFGNLAANVAQARQAIGHAAGWGGTTMDWLPWSHVSGAFAPLLTLVAGGTLYIDEGKPLPGPLWEESLRNLREISGPYYVNVPLGYGLLVEALEADEALRATFFRELRVLLYGGAGLPQPLYERLQRLAVRTVGRRIALIAAYGATETTSGCMAIHFETDRPGIGLPMPGTVAKLLPVDDRYEIRIGGPIVTQGYLGDADATAASRDEEGFVRLGDLVRFHDPADPAQGLAFAGRLAEEFKLGSGTWVSAGALRAQLLAALSPWVSELVVCGEGEDAIGLLAWVNRAAAARDFGLEAGAPLEGPPAAALRAALRERLLAHNAAHPGASTRVRRGLLLAEPPNAGTHEVSDKGTINRRVVLERRSADFARLYADPADDDVIALP